MQHTTICLLYFAPSALVLLPAPVFLSVDDFVFAVVLAVVVLGFALAGVLLFSALALFSEESDFAFVSADFLAADFTVFVVGV